MGFKIQYILGSLYYFLILIIIYVVDKKNVSINI
jgi:hypothetical protein